MTDHSKIKVHINLDHIAQIVPQHSTIIVGLSGGPDSVCLLHILSQLKTSHNLTIIAAHLDHGWREESRNDRMWCQKLCLDLQIPFIFKHASELQQPAHNGSKEELGRKLRRSFFEACAVKYQANYIALAHHQDDQLETFFIRLLRGSSLAGLASMSLQAGLYLRPLLNYRKQDIMQYLFQNQLSYLTDHTNESNLYLRNRIRNMLIPTLGSVDHRWNMTMNQSIKQLELANQFIQSHTQEKLSEISHLEYDVRKVNISQFLTLHITIQQGILLILMIETKAPFTPSQKLFCEISRFINHGVKKSHEINPKFVLHKNADYFYFQTI